MPMQAGIFPILSGRFRGTFVGIVSGISWRDSHMTNRLWRRVLAMLACMTLILAITPAPVAAVIYELPGEFLCPSRPTGIHVVFRGGVWVWPPGIVNYRYSWSQTWTSGNYAGAIGGGSYDIDWNDSVNLTTSYLYCS